MDEQELAKLLKGAGEDPAYIIGTSSTLNADGTVTITGGGRSVNAIAQTAFRSGTWSAKRVGNTWYAWSGNAPIVESQSRFVRRQTPPSKKKAVGLNYVILFDSNLLTNIIIGGLPPAQNYSFTENLFFRLPVSASKTIYTFSDNPGEGVPRKFPRQDNIDFLKTKATVKEVTIAQLGTVNSAFYLPLMDANLATRPNPFIDVTQSTIDAIKIIAKKYGVILQGENQESFNPLNHYLMDKFYKPYHSDYNYVFPDGIGYYTSFLVTVPYKVHESKYSKVLFKGIEDKEVRTSISAGIPVDLLPPEECLAVFDFMSQKYAGVIGWQVKN